MTNVVLNCSSQTIASLRMDTSHHDICVKVRLWFELLKGPGSFVTFGELELDEKSQTFINTYFSCR